MVSLDFDVIVIGGGPVGGFVAGQLASRGHRVCLLEEHYEIGEPVQCGGIIHPRVLTIVPETRRTVLREIRGCEFYSPSGREVVVDGGETEAIVVDRQWFDKVIVGEALRKGAEARLGAMATRAWRQDGHLAVEVLQGGRRYTLTSRLVIGADGVKSMTAKWFGLAKPYRILPGFEAEMANVEFTDGYVKVFTGREVAPGFFAWIAPTVEDQARVGLCLAQGNCRGYFERMLVEGPPSRFLGRASELGYIIGGIPIGFAKRTYGDGVLLVGDAACQAKATSGGGLYTGLLCATKCALVADEALEAGDTSAAHLARYQELWVEAIGKELRRYWWLHKVLAGLRDDQLEEVFDILDNPRMIKTINELGDIDYPVRVVLGLLREDPRLLKFMGPALKALF